MAPADAGQAYPPKDYAKWGELVYQWTKHCVEKYGAAEVNQWYWEVWNEPNISYWHGTREELFQAPRLRRGRRAPRLADGARRRTGDCGRAGRNFPARVSSSTALRGTNYATGKIGTPLDFISFHAKGSPDVHRQRLTSAWAWRAQLRNIDDAFAVVASFPE